MGAFHAYDIRGIWGKDIDSDFAYRAGCFLPRLLAAREILVGRDMRTSSGELHEALVRGITDAGADVFDIGLSTTPMVYFATAKKGFKGSVQITASHNPKEYNGMKISREGAMPVGLDNGLGLLRTWMESDEPSPAAAIKGKVTQVDFTGEYLAFISGFKKDISNLKIAIDCSNGMSSMLAGKLFGETPTYICNTLDGTFPNHEANPLLSENREMLRDAVLSGGCDVGVIFDGDADRVMFLDEKGDFVQPDLLIALLGDYFLRERGEKGRVLQDIRSSKSVAEYLAPLGGEVHTWKVGRANAAPKLREIGGIFGGELAGHYYFRDFFYSDSGLLASTIILGLLAERKRNGQTFSQVMSSISRYCNSGEINFRISDKERAMKAVCDALPEGETPVSSSDFDGFRRDFKEWWFNIRPSNTEPLVRFICEASDRTTLERKIALVRSIVERR